MPELSPETLAEMDAGRAALQRVAERDQRAALVEQHVEQPAEQPVEAPVEQPVRRTRRHRKPSEPIAAVEQPSEQPVEALTADDALTALLAD